MAWVDRTEEFRRLAPSAAPVSRSAPTPPPAAEIARQLGHTARLIGELVQRAKAGLAPFAAQDGSLNQLAHIIKGNLDRLAGRVAAAEVRTGMTPQEKEHTRQVVSVARDRLQQSSSLFKSALEAHTQRLVRDEERRARLGITHSIRAPAPTVQEEPEELSVMIAIPGREDDVSLAAQRSEQIHDLEARVADTAGLFQRLAAIVATHREQIDRIEDNVIAAEVYADSARSELVRYLGALSSERWLIAKLFFILLLLIGVFVLFFL